jgi:hypothetical protein
MSRLVLGDILSLNISTLIYNYLLLQSKMKLIMVNRRINKIIKASELNLSDVVLTSRKASRMLINNTNISGLNIIFINNEPILTTLISILPKLKHLILEVNYQTLGFNDWNLDIELLLKCQKLKKLKIMANFKKIHLLSRLNLTSLSLIGVKKIKDLTALKKCISLEFLSLSIFDVDIFCK